MATTEVEVVSPARVAFTGEVEMVVCRSVDGEIALRMRPAQPAQTGRTRPHNEEIALGRQEPTGRPAACSQFVRLCYKSAQIVRSGLRRMNRPGSGLSSCLGLLQSLGVMPPRVAAALLRRIHGYVS